MDNFEEVVAKLDKKLDRLTTLVTKIAKTLHLIPVTEKEEREIQLLQRKNLGLAAKVSEELDEMSPKDPSAADSSIFTIYANMDGSTLYDDVLGDDFRR